MNQQFDSQHHSGTAPGGYLNDVKAGSLPTCVYPVDTAPLTHRRVVALFGVNLGAGRCLPPASDTRFVMTFLCLPLQQGIQSWEMPLHHEGVGVYLRMKGETHTSCNTSYSFRRHRCSTGHGGEKHNRTRKRTRTDLLPVPGPVGAVGASAEPLERVQYSGA